MMYVYGTAYLYANNNVVNSQYFSTTFYWYGGSYGNTIYGNVVVPPGVSKEVYASYSIYTQPGFNEYTKHEGNKTYVYYVYYPTGPYISTQSYTFNWYEYNVTVPIHIVVYNGSNPVTEVSNKTFSSRNFTVYLSYITWSSDPQSNSISIVTHDHIQISNYTIERTWNAGTIEIIPQLYTQ